MPRFHFHTEDGRKHPDADGLQLADERAARSEAIKALGQLVEAMSEEFWRDGMFRMTVTDDAGLTLIVLDLSATISPALEWPR